MTYRQLLKSSIASHQQYSAEIQLLMLAYCQQQAEDLYANYDQEVPDAFLAKYEAGLARIVQDEPLAYILGYEPFYGYDILVDRRALIPRPETEELVNEVLMLLDDKKEVDQLQGLDLGTGSGAIAVVLALEDQRVKMVASDISSAALALAQENINKFQVDVTLLESDLFKQIPKDVKFDFIVCNPPYIKDAEILEKSVYDYEPHQALYGGKDGLYFYEKVLAQAKSYLKDTSFLAFEIGYDQGERLLALALNYYPNSEVLIKKDINGKDRFLIIQIN